MEMRKITKRKLILYNYIQAHSQVALTLRLILELKRDLQPLDFRTYK